MSPAIRGLLLSAVLSVIAYLAAGALAATGPGGVVMTVAAVIAQAAPVVIVAVLHQRSRWTDATGALPVSLPVPLLFGVLSAGLAISAGAGRLGAVAGSLGGVLLGGIIVLVLNGRWPAVAGHGQLAGGYR
jgi:hypothetical protein